MSKGVKNVDIIDDDEREEGEIVDISGNEYEDISSNEEFVLKERIAELEARNLELEKLASISSFPIDYDSDHVITKDSLGSIGEIPFPTYHGASIKPKSPASRIKRVKSYQRTSRSSKIIRRRKLRRSPSYSPSYKNYRDKRKSKIKIDSKIKKPKKKKTDKKLKYSSSSDDEGSVLNREHLAAALGKTQQIKSINNLTEKKLLIQKTLDPHPIILSDEDENVLQLRLEALKSKNSSKPPSPKPIEPNIKKRDYDDVTLEEQELRLIALKSAYVKKNEARKKRKLLLQTQLTERPYSPTDDIIKLETPENGQETDYSDNNMDISPINSPIPNNPDDECKTMDMELAISEENSTNSVSFVESLFAPELQYYKTKDKISLNNPLINQMPVNNVYLYNNSPNQMFLVTDDCSNLHQNQSNDNLELPQSIEEDNKITKSFIYETNNNNNEPIPIPISLNEDQIEHTNTDSVPLETNNDIKSNEKEENVADISLEADCLRSLLLSDMNKRSKAKLLQPIVEENPKIDEIQTEIPQKDDEIKLNAKNQIKKSSKNNVKAKIMPKEIPKSCDITNNLVKSETIPKLTVNKQNSNNPKIIFSHKIISSNRIQNIVHTENRTSSTNSSPIPFESKIVPKLIIQLGKSDSESETETENLHEKKLRAITTTNNLIDINQKNNFDKKLDDFLKNVRNQVEKQTTPKKLQENMENKIKTKTNTPLAVRHLPPSSQMEYKSLVNRMKLLEKQKSERLLKKVNVKNNNIEVTIKNNLVSSNNESTNAPETSVTPTVPVATVESKEITKNSVLKKNENIKITENVSNQAVCQRLADKKGDELNKLIENLEEPEKDKMLKQSETEYDNYSAIFISELNYLINILKIAQTEKEKEISLENEVQKLHEQLKLKEKELEEQKKNLTRNYISKISISHKKIVKYRQEFSNIDRVCKEIGKIIQGNEYKLPEIKHSLISEKLKSITSETKKLTSMKTKSPIKVPREEKVNNETKNTLLEVRNNNILISNEEIEQPEPKETLINNTQSTIPEYKSPLEILKSSGQSSRDPNGVICPFELSGKCEDSSCKYEHFVK